MGNINFFDILLEASEASNPVNYLIRLSREKQATAYYDLHDFLSEVEKANEILFKKLSDGAKSTKKEISKLSFRANDYADKHWKKWFGLVQYNVIKYAIIEIRNTWNVTEEKEPDELECQLRESLKPFSGKWQGKEIMKPAQFNEVIKNTKYFLQNKKLPENIKQLPALNISAIFIRYTFYELYKLHKSSWRGLKPLWIQFLKKSFSQFDNWALDSLEDSFSTKPPSYKQDLSNIVYKN
jgi:hypothetical protein